MEGLLLQKCVILPGFIRCTHVNYTHRPRDANPRARGSEENTGQVVVFIPTGAPDDCHHGTIDARSSERGLTHSLKHQIFIRDFLYRVSHKISLGAILVDEAKLKA